MRTLYLIGDMVPSIHNPIIQNELRSDDVKSLNETTTPAALIHHLSKETADEVIIVAQSSLFSRGVLISILPPVERTSLNITVYHKGWGRGFPVDFDILRYSMPLIRDKIESQMEIYRGRLARG